MKLLALPLLLLFAVPAAGGGPGEAKVDFTRDVRPILANNCLLCHGPDAKGRKGDLRLDVRDGALADLGDGKRAVVPGKPDQSELLKRVTTADPDDVMPPKKTGKKLSKAEIDTLRRWIEQGAPFAKHWAFVKPARPALPAVKDGAWPKNEIDRFVLARLEAGGLKPSPEADRFALVRRASLDLTGLPPTIEEADRFANDAAPDAYEKLVDRLLRSPGFGERWARVWLDLARYADSQGYAEDRPRTVWAFRDWVVRALNANMPFDRFTVEQIAGDLLPDATEEQLQATAFHRNTLTNTEGGTDDEEFRNAAVVDRVNTTMQVWMGLTLNCSQCHDHKYDPFSQEEFFKIFAYFNQTQDNDAPDDRPFLSLYSPEQKKQQGEWEAEIARLEASIAKPDPAVDAGRKKWEAAIAKPVAWTTVKPEAPAAQEDGSIVASAAPKGVTTVRATVDSRATAFRLEVPPQGDFILSRLTCSVVPAEAKPPQARFVRVELPGAGKYIHMAEVEVFSGGANVAPKGKATQSGTGFDGPANLANDGNTNGDYNAKSVSHTGGEENPWWEVDLGAAVPVDRVVVWNRTDGGDAIMERIKGYRLKLLDANRKAVHEKKDGAVPKPSAAFRFDGAQPVAFRSAQATSSKKGHGAEQLIAPPDPKKPGWSAEAGKAQEAVLVLEKPLAPGRLQFTLEQGAAPIGRFRLSLTDDPLAPIVLETPAEVRADAAKREAHYRSVAPELAPQREKLAAVRKQLGDQKPAATLPVMREVATRRKTQVQIRGNFLAKGQEVSEGVPEALHPDAALPKNRLGLARWLVHPDNPLSARVAVNRHWEQLFGTGIVATSEDFGVRGETPSHPELLDWMAVEFVASGWDLKKLIRSIVTSATYRQSSRVTPELIRRDPSNRLLAVGPRQRLPAETVRDQALHASGLLSAKMGGPSVHPPRPKFGLSAAFSSSTDWEDSKGEDRYRRGLYTFWRRSLPYPSMATFDAPSGEVCTVRRIATNTPLQALVTMNDPVYVEAAQALARKMLLEGGADARAKAAHGFRRCLSRPPHKGEVDRLVALYEEARTRFAAAKDKAQALATEPLGPAPAGADVVDLAAWTVVGNVLLNLDETFMKR